MFSFTNVISQNLDIESVKQAYHKLRNQSQLPLEDSLVLVNNLYEIIYYHFYEGETELYNKFENEFNSFVKNFNHPLPKLRILQVQDLHINESVEGIEHSRKMIEAFNDAIGADPENQELLESKALRFQY